MSVREIRLLGDSTLREECEPVEDVEEVRELVDDMLETMYDADGIGLAAPQVGVPLRLFVYDVREPGSAAGVLINPELVESEGAEKDEEGCLSIPGLTGAVERPERIVMRGLDRDGEEVRIEAEGLLARCLQHERDHLDGILFLDHLSPLKRRLLMRKWSDREEERETESRAGAL